MNHISHGCFRVLEAYYNQSFGCSLSFDDIYRELEEKFSTYWRLENKVLENKRAELVPSGYGGKAMPHFFSFHEFVAYLVTVHMFNYSEEEPNPLQCLYVAYKLLLNAKILFTGEESKETAFQIKTSTTVGYIFVRISEDELDKFILPKIC